MARPALSAARGIDIIELFAASAERSLSMSEISRATGINIASCHAVLTVLVDRGYLTRDPQNRSYAPGPALYAAGQAALLSQPLLAEARNAAQAVAAELGVPVLISGAVGQEIVGLVEIPDAQGRTTGLRVGERRALVPPIGAPFVAWAGEAAIDEWLARTPDAAPALVADLRQVIATIRRQGYEVLLRSADTARLASQLIALAAPGSVLRLGPDMTLPASIDPEMHYEVMMIAAPIFDRHGACVFNMCLGPFGDALCGRDVTDRAERLLRACLDVMHADRAAR